MDDKKWISASDLNLGNLSDLPDYQKMVDPNNTLSRFDINDAKYRKEIRRVTEEAFQQGETQRQNIRKISENTNQIKNDVQRIDNAIKIETDERKEEDEKNRVYTDTQNKKVNTYSIISIIIAIASLTVGIIAILVSVHA